MFCVREVFYVIIPCDLVFFSNDDIELLISSI